MKESTVIDESCLTPPPVRPPNAEEEDLKRQVARQCEADRALLISAQPFTARLLMQLSVIPVVDDRLPTACTDGQSIFVNASFMSQRSADDRRFILAHEVWHCALGHHRRQLGRELERWNHACDYEVNALLEQDLGHCPRDALCDSRYKDQSAEQIYVQLNKRETPEGNTLDEHDAQALLGRTGQVMDPDFAPRQVTPENANAWQRRLIATAQQHNRYQGSLPGHLNTLVERLREGTMPWQQVLAKHLYQPPGGSRQWLPPSRRHLSRGLYLPSHRTRTLKIAVALDGSGSCLSELPLFLGELKKILGAFECVELEVLEFDTRVTKRATLNEGQLHQLEHWTCHGGGGSDIRPLMAELDTRPPRLLLVLTDGYINIPRQAPNYAVIWCLAPGGRRPARWGQEVRLGE